MSNNEFKLIIVLCVLAFTVLLCGCDLNEQSVEGYEPSCKVFLTCMYYNQKNPDKSVCLSLADGCKSANDFQACLNPVLKDNKMEFKDCLLLMRK
jgi:hypothetical protein